MRTQDASCHDLGAEPISKERQRRFIADAVAAAKTNDPPAMLEALVEGRVLDGLRASLISRGPRLIGYQVHEVEADFALGYGIDEAFRNLVTGKEIRDFEGFVFVVASRKLKKLADERRRESGSGDLAEVAANGERDLLHWFAREPPVERDAMRREAVTVTRHLLNELGQENVQRVMEFILEAVEGGVDYLPDKEVGEALGLTTEVAKKSRERGFRRLAQRAHQRGIGSEILERLREDISSTDDGADYLESTT